MGSTTPPDSPPNKRLGANITQHSQPDDVEPDLSAMSKSELRLLLERKIQEIRALKFELEKYKMALDQSQSDRHFIRQQTSGSKCTNKNGKLLLDSSLDKEVIFDGSGSEAFLDEVVAANSQQPSQQQRVIATKNEASAAETSDIVNKIDFTSTSSKELSSKVIFKTGADDDEEDEEEEDEDEDEDDIIGKVSCEKAVGDDSKSDLKRIIKVDLSDGSKEDDLDDIIQDISEIDLDLDLDSNQSKSRAISENVESRNIVGQQSCDKRHNEEDDMMSDQILTSLTDAAISNLSQLAALQERCESQQQQHQFQAITSQPNQQRLKQASTNILTSRSIQTSATESEYSSSAIVTVAGDSSMLNANSAEVSNQQNRKHNFDQDPFSRSAIANQAALAISAAAELQTPSVMNLPQQTNLSPSSISPNSTIQPDLGTGQSLASVVAAAAVAAAAAANDQQQMRHHHPIHQSRLISSALPSPEFYQSFSPSTSITPSPSSLLSHSRRSISNTSSILSPMSPNYLRRQYIPERVALMSPSPTSLTTGSNSAASGSLAHLLHHQSSQQRSASALAGPITSSSTSTPISGTGSNAITPLMGSKNSSQARLNNMQIRHKFGYLGSGRAQFNSPHGFCLGLNQEIVVADTNNHRVCIFDKSGTYITQFGSPGKEEGQLWNPRKVAILHRSISGQSSCVSSGRLANQTSIATTTSSISSQFESSSSETLYVVCDRGAERSRMQLFTKDGVFIKKIGIHYIDIVAGLAITQNGLIIVVDSVSPTVYIINGDTGTLNGWFDCSGHMKEPSDIAVKSDVPGNEYFICDFKGHCVVVFSEQGEYLRKIGHDGLTSYPNGIDISDDGDILVGDSHGNRFHVVVFDRNGNFVSQFECPHVKVSRCCGLKITREGYIVTLAKNNHHVLVLDTIHI